MSKRKLVLFVTDTKGSGELNNLEENCRCALLDPVTKSELVVLMLCDAVPKSP